MPADFRAVYDGVQPNAREGRGMKTTFITKFVLGVMALAVIVCLFSSHIPCGLSFDTPMPYDFSGSKACYYLTKTKWNTVLFLAVELGAIAALWWLWHTDQITRYPY
jgi:hypothetical protein